MVGIPCRIFSHYEVFHTSFRKMIRVFVGMELGLVFDLLFELGGIKRAPLFSSSAFYLVPFSSGTKGDPSEGLPEWTAFLRVEESATLRSERSFKVVIEGRALPLFVSEYAESLLDPEFRNSLCDGPFGVLFH